ncbi:hypothetical protein MtrunA17_Chr5g0400841 [Medicago truncatula]|uniref:Uncharacterized protein n=1 Tax=Medicago truncatula TaxID=3880 RepID=A0A396HT55_MEDTR|nr:hypothetical protein MtrunA17_Chr5g0400841 [Medicago truncatula]
MISHLVLWRRRLVQILSSDENKDFFPSQSLIVLPDIKPIKIEHEIVNKKLPTNLPMARC